MTISGSSAIGPSKNRTGNRHVTSRVRTTKSSPSRRTKCKLWVYFLGWDNTNVDAGNTVSVQHCFINLQITLKARLPYVCITGYASTSPYSITLKYCTFSDFMLRGSDELGDNNQPAVALVLIPLIWNKWRQRELGVTRVDISERA